MATEQENDLLTDPRFEVLPFSSFDDQLEAIPDGSKIAITSSPEKSIMKTIELTEQAANDGYEVIPHLAARNVEDEAQLEEIAQRLEDVGVDDIFVPGGDNDEAGEFESSYELLVALEELGYEFPKVGITGYPEGHAFIEDDTLWEHLEKKEEYGDYIITQICFKPDTVVEWIDEVRAHDVELPIEVGVPGAMDAKRMLSIAREVGVGDSIKYLQKTTGIGQFAKSLLGGGGKYTPDDFIEGIAPHYQDDHYKVSGVHLYTMNQAADTEEWRQDFMDN
ncbi:methylenetetrahydrofolate reductase [Haloarculaceae archaeon H-GB2-1]|nr:methylenetetrahydrofolate reductase [Haloarculaceae archaeon H-GB1-1]MEA5387374.1 methylenetetrahydrofolate reductase [Haloarculaceae archaeon H-GB11]MEA5408845.1 methylenetetrahydrofolate reductase [Haloarculaceae archaeon H-GB2-1]